MIEDTKKSPYPYEEVFELTIQGASRQEISDELEISIWQVDRTRRCEEYKQLKRESDREKKEKIHDFKLQQADLYKSFVVKAQQRLLELVDSKNEKIAVDASKFLITQHSVIIKAIEDTDLATINDILSELEE